MRVIGTLYSLYPTEKNYSFAMQQYALLSYPQKSAIALFLLHVQELVGSAFDESILVKRALSIYWEQFLAYSHDA
jgi:hypothetical protein